MLAMKGAIVTIQQAIGSVLQSYIDKGYVANAEQVNHGGCEEFAEDVCRLVPDAEAWWDDELGDYGDDFGGHKVIRYQGMFYDSQCPDGTLNWAELVRFPSPCNGYVYPVV